MRVLLLPTHTTEGAERMSDLRNDRSRHSSWCSCTECKPWRLLEESQRETAAERERIATLERQLAEARALLAACEGQLFTCASSSSALAVLRSVAEWFSANPYNPTATPEPRKGED